MTGHHLARGRGGPPLSSHHLKDPEDMAVCTLERAFGAGASAASGVAPGRVPLVGEHVDYVGGRIVCMAIDLVLAVAVRPSADRRWRMVSGERRVERSHPTMAGDVGDRVLAAAVTLSRRGVGLPPLEMAVAGDLPEAAGLSSSAAVTAAAMVAMLRLSGARLSAEDFVTAALSSERDIVGVPCGDLDQRAVVHSRAGSVLLLDCARKSHEELIWPWPEIGVVIAMSGAAHDVGGIEYAARREAATRACAELGVAGCQAIGDRWRELPAELRSRGRHIATETLRADAAIAALRAGDADELGRLIDESHESLRHDYEVSTDRLDAMTARARGVAGCRGARLVGAGFGGSAMALVDVAAARDCAAAMASAAGRVGGTWLVRAGAGVEVTANDVIVDAPRARDSGIGRGPADPSHWREGALLRTEGMHRNRSGRGRHHGSSDR